MARRQNDKGNSHRPRQDEFKDIEGVEIVPNLLGHQINGDGMNFIQIQQYFIHPTKQNGADPNHSFQIEANGPPLK
jgi:hypothetical protein